MQNLSRPLILSKIFQALNPTLVTYQTNGAQNYRPRSQYTAYCTLLSLRSNFLKFSTVFVSVLSMETLLQVVVLAECKNKCYCFMVSADLQVTLVIKTKFRCLKIRAMLQSKLDLNFKPNSS